MIKIISDKVHRCPYCGRMLSYEAGDVKWKELGEMGLMYKVLRCPICGKESKVE